MPHHAVHGRALEIGRQHHEGVGTEVLRGLGVLDRVARADRRGLGDEAGLAAHLLADDLVNAPALRLRQIREFASAAAGQNDMHAGIEQHIDMCGKRALVDPVARFVERRADRDTDAFEVGHGEISFVFELFGSGSLFAEGPQPGDAGPMPEAGEVMRPTAER